MSKLEKFANPHSLVGKTISVILTISLALMMWDVNAMNYAFAADDDAPAKVAQAEKPAATAAAAADENKSSAAKAEDKSGKETANKAEATAPAPETPSKDEGSSAAPEPTPAPTTPEPSPSDEPADTPAADNPSGDDTTSSGDDSGENAGDNTDDSSTATSSEGSDENADSPESTDDSDKEAVDEDEDGKEDKDDKEAKEKEEDKDVKYPATSLDGSANGVSVHVTVPDGALPEGVKLVVKGVSSGSVEGAVDSVLEGDPVNIKAVDISFSWKNKKGETVKVKPKKNVTVTLQSSVISAAAADENQEMHLIHIGGSGPELMGASASGSQMTFSTRDFSTFVLAAENTAATEGTWTVNFHNRDGAVIESRNIEQADGGTAIGDLPTVPSRDGYTGHWAIGSYDSSGQGSWKPTGGAIDSGYLVTGDLDIVPDYEKVTYTVSFYDSEDATTPLTTKTVNVDSNYCLNDIPTVPTKNGYVGKWVYSGGDFNNTVAVEADTKVWADYTQNVFTATYYVGENVYNTDEYYSGDALSLPANPVVTGKEFQGWYIGEKQYHGGETVTSDLTLEAKFSDQYSVRFMVPNDDGTQTETLVQYFRDSGQTVGTMPQDPFVAGKIFDKWVIEGTDTPVTAETVVNDNIVAIATFHPVSVYKITAEYYYKNSQGEDFVFNTDLMQVEAHELPYTITAPSSTQTDPNQVPTGPVYYPENPTIKVTADDFDDNNECTVRFQYVPFTAQYDFVYMLKDLTGNGYTEIPNSREHNVQGVLGSYVTPTVKNFDYAVLESAEGANITQAEGQELVVKYTRKNFQLSYETNGGSYVAGSTVPYGTTVTVSSTTPTRDGYTFAGWYMDEALTQAAGNSVTVNKNTTLYAKWNPQTVNYTIVYMFEKYNDTGTTATYVYDNSRTATAQVGSTVQASSAPTITRTGWEKDTDRNNASSVTIAADGSSVLLVYYKLKEYTFTFDLGTYTTYRMTIKGTTYYNNNGSTQYSFKAKLGQNISNDWPVNGGNARIWDSDTRNTYYFYAWECQGTNYATKQLIVNTALIPTGNSTSVTVTGQWLPSNNAVTINYYFQNADDDEYTLSSEYSQTVNSSGGRFSAKTIAGYTYDHGDSGKSGLKTYNFYYNRDKYAIDYYYGSTKLKTIDNVKFDATISSNTYNWTPTAAQCGVDEDYTFAGWYADSG